MSGAFCRDARTGAVEGQQTTYVNLWDLWHMGTGQVQTVASAVARRTRATAEAAVSTIWSVCGRLWRFACAFRTTCRRRSRRRAADRPEARAVASAPEGAACDRTEPRSSRGTWPASAAALGGCAAPCGRGGRGSTGVSAAMSPRDALKWVSRGRALENELGRLRGERARTSRGCGGVSARQGDIGAVEDSMSDAEYTLATRTA